MTSIFYVTPNVSESYTMQVMYAYMLNIYNA